MLTREDTNQIEPKLNNWMHQKIEQSQEYQEKAYKEVNELIIRKVTLRDGSILTEFVSCSYLGLDQHPAVINASSRSHNDCGISFHSARTRMIPESFVELDALLEKIYTGAYPVTFPALHMAHLGLFPLLGSGEMPSFPIADNGCLFILDKTVHSSIQINRGLMNQFGKVVIVDFQNVGAIEFAAKQSLSNKMTPIFLADSVGSMGGVSPTTELLKLSEKYNGYVYLDDAHGTSIHGNKGSGYVYKEINDEMHPRLIISASLGKGFGALGGALLFPTKEDAEFTKHYSPTYMFGGPPSLSIIDATIASSLIHLSDEIYTLQNKLWENIKYFDSKIDKSCMVNSDTPSPIRGVLIGDEFSTIRAAKTLQKQGFALTTAMYPVVPKGRGMLRAAFSSSHSFSQIDELCSVINSTAAKV